MATVTAAPTPPTAATTTTPPRKATFASRAVQAAGRGPLHLILVLIALYWLVPTIGLAFTSLRTNEANSSTGWWTALTEPSQLTLDNYLALLDNSRITDSLFNTVLITVPTTVLVVVVAALAAYALAWVRFPGRDWVFLLVIGLLVVPLQVALIPVAEIFGNLGIFGTITSVILFHVAFGLPFAVFLLRNFFVGIPRELLEAARIDGAGELRIFFRVVMPIAVPAIASLAIFQFLWTWNDLLVGLVFAESANAPITVAIREQTRRFGGNIDIIAPGAFISLVIPLAVFFAFQRYFVQGILAGSEK
ncbi:carbohydrate ABC transporter permease [soil metagenome]